MNPEAEMNPDRIDPEKIFQRYQEMQRYIGWTEADARRIHAVADILEPHLATFIDDFYEEIDRHPDTRKVITGGPTQIARLKGTLRTWLRDLLYGPYDRDYAVRRWRIGWRHVEIGLDQVYTNVALARLRIGVARVLRKGWHDSADELIDTIQSLNKLFDLDLAKIEDAYQAAFASRVQSSERLAAREQLVQSERLAAIGQMMAVLAHESGNALARIKASLEMLAWEVEDRPEALELIDRIQKAQNHLKQLYDEVRNYAAPFKLDREVWDLSGIWRQAWENLAIARQGREAALSEETNGLDLHCSVDQFRLEQLFRVTLDNALTACADPVRVAIRCTPAEIDGQPGVQVSIQDNGPGLNAEQRQRIFDAFYTTKTKGTGLGMAIAKRIAEAHGGRIAVGPGVGGGTEIVLILPRERQ